MINKLKPKSEFSRNVLTLMTGTTIAQAIPIAISPILTRIYTPEDFGMFALYMSVASILSVVATGRYELAIMLPKKDEDAVNIVVLSIIISFFVSFISLVIVYLFNTQITKILGSPEVSSWLYFVPISVLFTGVYQSLNYWNNRKKQYKKLATNRVLLSGTTATINLGMGFGGLGSSGLILGTIVGQGVATSVLGNILVREQKDKLKIIKKLKVFALAKKYIEFPKYSIFSDLLTALNSQLAVLFLANLFNLAAVGFFSFATRIIRIPMSILSSSIGDVFREEANSYYSHNKECEAIYINVLRKLFITAILPFFLLYLYAPLLFELAFGEEWREAGVYTRILIPMFFLQFISSPLSMMYYVAQKQLYYLWFMMFMFGSSVTLFLIIFMYKLDINEFLKYYSFVYGFFYLLNIAITYILAKKRDYT
jgi:O-antigen/teichoic acid export membrane protein